MHHVLGLKRSPDEVSRTQAKPSPNAFNEGYRERIALERSHAGIDRKDAALGQGTAQVGNEAMLAFIYDREESAKFGGPTSASQGTPRAAPRGEVRLDCRAPELIEAQKDKARAAPIFQRRQPHASVL